MKVIDFRDNQKIIEDVIPLFLEAFPEEERPPVSLLKKTIKRKSSELLAYYDKDEFIGFTLLSFYKDLAYMYFFAVSSSKRNQGYGSKILHLLFERHEDITIFLLYDEIDDKYPDNELRKRRRSFYLRNGFKENDFHANEFGVNYGSLYHGVQKVSYETYHELMVNNVGKVVEDKIKRVG